jgi:Tfp pilus assembly protein PilE
MDILLSIIIILSVLSLLLFVIYQKRRINRSIERKRKAAVLKRWRRLEEFKKQKKKANEGPKISLYQRMAYLRNKKQ